MADACIVLVPVKWAGIWITGIRMKFEGKRALLVHGYAALLLVGAAVLLFSFQRRAVVSVPFLDEFVFSRLYEEILHDGHPSLKTLFTAHNGHVYTLLYLIIWVALGVGLPWKWLMFAQVPILALAAVVALRNLDMRGRGWVVCTATAAVVFSVLSIRMWENLYWGMQISAALGLLFAFLAFNAAARYDGGESNWSHLCWALLWALLALLSTGSGIVATLVVCAWLGLRAAAQRNARHLLVLLVLGASAIALHWLTLDLAARGETDAKWPPLDGFAKHVLHMFAHAFIDLDNASPFAPWIGLAFLGVAVAAALVSMRQAWIDGQKEQAFALLLIAYAAATIAGISWARMKAGIWQPDAPRYYLYVLPLAVGIFLAFSNPRALRWGGAVWVLFLLAAANLIHSAKVEWGVSPYRKLAMEAHRTDLCETGFDGKERPYNLTDEQIRRIRALYCRPGVLR